MTKQQTILGGLTLLIIAGVASGLIIFNNQTETAQPNQSAAPTVLVSTITPTPTQAESASDPVAATPSLQFTNGTYTATGSYTSPGGRESVQVSLTVIDDAVSEATITSLAKHPTSKQYQGQFVSGIKQYVVGKPLSEIQVSRVSGSSLTSIGFNQALAAIIDSATR